MKITKEKIKAMNPCSDGYAYWLEQGIYDLADFMIKAHTDGHSDWAIWLFARSVEREKALKMAIFSADLVLPISEKDYPDDNRPRKAIEAAKAVLLDDTQKNRDVAAYTAAAAASAASSSSSSSASSSSAAYYAASAAASTSASSSACAASAASSASDVAADDDAADATYKKIIYYAVGLL